MIAYARNLCHAVRTVDFADVGQLDRMVATMKVFLTGGTGYIGSHVLDALVRRGHEVTALVRSDSAADRLRSEHVTPVVGDLTDAELLAATLREVDASIHLASPGDATSAQVDTAIADVVSRELGAGKVHVHTSGAWAWGAVDGITEGRPLDAPALVAWRGPIESELLKVSAARIVIIAPGVVYGDGGGLANLIVSAPRTPDGELVTIGSGQQRWATVHVRDLADLYVLALESDRAEGYILAVNSDSPTVRELTQAVSRASGAGSVTTESDDQARERLGAYLADALLLDQRVSNAKALALGWLPKEPSLVDELERGSYRPTAQE